MNYRRFILIIVAASLVVQVKAQTDFRLQLIGGASLNTLSTGIFSNWKNGWMVGGGVSYPLNSSIEFSLNATYSRYPYQGDRLQLVTPDLVMPAVVGFRLSVSGKPSSNIEASLTTRLFASRSFIKSFLSVTTGLYHYDIGEIVISSWYESTPNIVSRSIYRNSGVSTIKGFAALGFGFAMPLNSSVLVLFEGRLTHAFNFGTDFIPLITTIQMDV